MLAGLEVFFMLTEFTKFYYSALSEEKKRIYRELYEGFKARQPYIEVHTDPSRISHRDVGDIAVSVYNDTPSFYYLDTSKYTYVKTPYGYRYSQKYIYSEQQILNFDRQLSEGLKAFAAKYIKPGMTDYQKEKVIHDYLIRTVTYDMDAITGTRHIAEAYNVLGALLKKRAVCWGIACAFKLLCDYCRIKSFVVIGESVPKEGDMGHAWNMVKIDGKTYHVDVTWDIKVKGDISFCYEYFNLDDKLIQFDHAWQSTLYPKCDSNELNFYYKNHLFVKTTQELSDYVAMRLRANDLYIAVKFASAMPPKSVIEEAIRAGFEKAAKDATYYYIISEKTHNICVEVIP